MSQTLYARVDEQGRIILPSAMLRKLGLMPGDEIRIVPEDQGLHLRSSITTLRRVYIEATNKCNLTCATCMRNVWDVQYGHMKEDTFDRILSGLASLPEKPEIFFGGYGEPLSHPNILAMIECARERGYRVSMITNGILLTETVARRLIDLHLDMLWVSLDGASPECYSDVRLGDALPTVLENLARLRSLKYQSYGYSVWGSHPKLGIAFVAMRRNIHDLGEVIRLCSQLGAVEFSISNVLAHNPELLAENLYMRSLDLVPGQEIRPVVHLPLMDIQPQTLDALRDVFKEMDQIEFSGAYINRNVDRCPFIERGSLSVRSDGQVSPCLSLLYTPISWITGNAHPVNTL